MQRVIEAEHEMRLPFWGWLALQTSPPPERKSRDHYQLAIDRGGESVVVMCHLLRL